MDPSSIESINYWVGMAGTVAFAVTAVLAVAPKAMLFANHIDSLAACGILMGDNWLGKRLSLIHI